MVTKRSLYEIFSTGSKWAYRLGNVTRGGFETRDEAEEAAKDAVLKVKSSAQAAQTAGELP